MSDTIVIMVIGAGADVRKCFGWLVLDPVAHTVPVHSTMTLWAPTPFNSTLDAYDIFTLVHSN